RRCSRQQLRSARETRVEHLKAYRPDVSARARKISRRGRVGDRLRRRACPSPATSPRCEYLDAHHWPDGSTTHPPWRTASSFERRRCGFAARTSRGALNLSLSSPQVCKRILCFDEGGLSGGGGARGRLRRQREVGHGIECPRGPDLGRDGVSDLAAGGLKIENGMLVHYRPPNSASASFARVRFAMSETRPRPSLTRIMPGQRSSATRPAGTTGGGLGKVKVPFFLVASFTFILVMRSAVRCFFSAARATSTSRGTMRGAGGGVNRCHAAARAPAVITSTAGISRSSLISSPPRRRTTHAWAAAAAVAVASAGFEFVFRPAGDEDPGRFAGR